MHIEGRGIRKVSEDIIKNGRAFIITEQDSAKYIYEDLPDGTIKINPENSKTFIKLKGNDDWIPYEINNKELDRYQLKPIVDSFEMKADKWTVTPEGDYIYGLVHSSINSNSYVDVFFDRKSLPSAEISRVYFIESRDGYLEVRALRKPVNNMTGQIKIANMASMPEGEVSISEEGEVKFSTQKILDKFLRDRSKNLVLNGTLHFKDNTNFSGVSYLEKERPASYVGSLISRGEAVETDNFIEIDTNQDYILEFYAKSNEIYTMDCGLKFYDKEYKLIENIHDSFVLNTKATLSKSLEVGESVIEVNSLANWSAVKTSNPSNNNFIIWNQSGSDGYTYPPETYSTNVSINTISSINKTTNQIVLSSPWDSLRIENSTVISQLIRDVTKSNILRKASNINIGTNWKKFSYNFSSYDSAVSNTKYPAGAVFVKVCFYPKEGTEEKPTETYLSGISLYENIKVDVSTEKINEMVNVKISEITDRTLDDKVQIAIGELTNTDMFYTKSFFEGQLPATVKKITGTDLNLITAPGTYHNNDIVTMFTNSPVAGIEFILDIDRIGGITEEMVAQTLKTINGEMYYRSVKGGVFSRWKNLVFDDEEVKEVYSKTEMDTKLNSKADKMQIYTRNETDFKLNAINRRLDEVITSIDILDGGGA